MKAILGAELVSMWNVVAIGGVKRARLLIPRNECIGWESRQGMQKKTLLVVETEGGHMAGV